MPLKWVKVNPDAAVASVNQLSGASTFASATADELDGHRNAAAANVSANATIEEPSFMR